MHEHLIRTSRAEMCGVQIMLICGNGEIAECTDYAGSPLPSLLGRHQLHAFQLRTDPAQSSCFPSTLLHPNLTLCPHLSSTQ